MTGPAQEQPEVRVRPPLEGGLFVLEVTGPLAATTPVLKDALGQVPTFWPLLLDLRQVTSVDGVVAGTLSAAAQRRLAASSAIAVVARDELLARLRHNGLSRLVLLHAGVADAATELRARTSGTRDVRRPIAYGVRRRA